MVIEDLVNCIKTKAYNDRAEQLIKLIQDELKDIESQNLHNEKNYKTLLTHLEKLDEYYDGFHVITQYNKLIGFAGLFSKRWGNVGRVLTTTYKIPSLRRKSLAYTDDKFQHLWSTNIAPIQVFLAKELKLDAVFVSTEYPRRHSSLNRFTDLTNKYISDKFVMQPHMYRTCAMYGDHWSCWQNITLCKLNPTYMFDFDMMTKEQWKINYQS